MAHFRAKILGNRGPASRLGSKKSGLWARLNGWQGEIVVDLSYDEERDRDVYHIMVKDNEGIIWEDIKGVLGPSDQK